MVFVLIIAGLIALVAYGFLMWWLFGTVAPEVLVLTSVAGTAIVPAAYGKAAWASFTPHGARRLFVAPVFGLLALIFVDIAYLVLEAVSVVGASVTAPLSEAFGFIALLPWVALDVDTDLSRPTLAAAVLLGTTVKGALLPAFLLLMRGLSNHVRDKKDPAFVQYFFVQARRDLWNVVLSVGRDSVQAFWWAMKWIHRLSWGRRMVVLFPLALTAYLALIPSAIAAIFTAFTLLALHFGGILLLWTLNMYVALLFFTVERAIIAVRSGFAKCPHAGCHKPVPNPIFFCSSCGVPHTRLVPGRCGVFYRVCAGEFGRPGCGARLPTTFLLGKSKLKSACNHCNQPLDGRLFGGSVHVPIYGGPSSGKTMFMMAATWQVVQRQLSGVECDFVNATDRDQYERKWRPNFEGGRVREKTQQMLPSAFLLWIRRVGGLPTSLYLYDSAGEVLEGGSEISAHRFIHFANGVALLIDPTALEAVRRAYDYAGQPLPTTASYADQRDVVDRMILALEDHLKIGRGRRIPKNLAVIFTKTDLPLVRQTLGLSSEAALKTSWRAAGSDADPPLRAWLRTHESRLFQVLETRFSKLRFFAVSALGHEPTAGASFSPKGVLAPVCWLLSTKPALSRPVSARFAGRAAECLAALGVFIGFVLPPLVGVPLTLSALTSLSWADTEPPPKRTLAATAPAPTLAIPPGSRLCTAKWGYYPNRGPTDGTTQLVFDAGGHLTHASTKVRECKLAGFQNTGCTDSSSESRFDYQGNLLKSRTDTPEPGLTVRTAFEYDDSGRLIQQVQTRHLTNAAPTTIRVSYRYDRKGTLQELSTDSNADGAPDTVDRFTALMDRRGNVVQLNVKRSKPTMTLPESSFGAIEKTTTFTYGKDGRLRQSKAQIKVAEANLKKPRTKRGTYGRSINLRRFTTLYTVSADGRVEHMKTCEDGKEDFSCATTALTYGTAGAPDTRTTNYNYESTTAELRGDCHIEQQGPLARYFVPQSIAWVNSTGTHFEPSLSLLAAAPDDPVFRVAAGGHLASSAARVP